MALVHDEAGDFREGLRFECAVYDDADPSGDFGGLRRLLGKKNGVGGAGVEVCNAARRE
jgi:hypothetical protein